MCTRNAPCADAVLCDNIMEAISNAKGRRVTLEYKFWFTLEHRVVVHPATQTICHFGTQNNPNMEDTVVSRSIAVDSTLTPSTPPHPILPF